MLLCMYSINSIVVSLIYLNLRSLVQIPYVAFIFYGFFLVLPSSNPVVTQAFSYKTFGPILPNKNINKRGIQA